MPAALRKVAGHLVETALNQSARVSGGSRLASPHRADSPTTARLISFVRAA